MKKIQQFSVQSVRNEASNFSSDNVRHEGRVSSSITHKNPQDKEAERKQLSPTSSKTKKRPTATRVIRLTTTTAYNNKGRQTTYPANPLHRSKQDSSGPDFSTPTTLRYGTYYLKVPKPKWDSNFSPNLQPARTTYLVLLYETAVLDYGTSTYFLYTYVATIMAHGNYGLQQQRTTVNPPF